MRSDLEIVAELIREQHQTDITAQDLQEIQEFLWLRSQAQLSPLSAPGDLGYLNTVDLNYDVVKIIGFVAGAVLGALFLPGLGLAAGWFAGALIGGAIGYRLASLFSNGNETQAPTKPSDTTLFKFSGVGGLVTLGTPIPKIYGNRANNPDGGVYLNDPGQIYTRVTSSKGSRYLDQLSVLAAGRLGEVNGSGLKLDDKPLTDWESGDVTVIVTSGYHNQASASNLMSGYSQALPLPQNSYVGLAPAVKIGLPTTAMDLNVFSTNSNIFTYGSGDFVKAASVAAGWNAEVVANDWSLAAGYGSYNKISGIYRPQNGFDTVRGAIGLSNINNPGADPANWFIGFEINGDNWRYWANSTNVESGTFTQTPGADITLEIRSYRSHPAGYIQILLNNVEVVRRINHTNADITSQWGVWSIHSQESAVITPRTAGVFIDNNDIMPGIGRRFRVKSDSIGKLRSGQIYRSEYGPSDILVVAKDVVSGWVEFSSDVWISDINASSAVSTPIIIIGQVVGVATNLMLAYRASVTTTKRITGAELLIQASVFAKDSNNNLVPHAQAFRVMIVDKNNNSYEASRFIIISTDEKPSIRSVIIENLPLDIYTFKVFPLSSREITSDIQSLEDAETRVVISPPGLIIGGQQTRVLIEAGNQILPADAAEKMKFDGKTQTSSDGGPAMQVTHINELVTASAQPTYPGYTLGFTRSIASDRLQSAATQSWDIVRGAIVRQYMAYGTTATNANPNRITVSENALVPGAVVPGDTVRILGFGNRVITQVIDIHTVECAPYTCSVTTIANSPIVSFADIDFSSILVGMPISAPGIPADSVVIAKLSTTTLLIGDEWERERLATASSSVTATFNTPLTQTSGEEAVFFSMGSSNYFPDLYVDRIINPVDGLGASIEQDYFIDYASIVYARKYCVKNKFFYDGVFSEGTFEAWAVATAPSSLLYCTEINGKFALVTQEGAPKAPFIFNDSNTSKYVEPGVPEQQEAVNTLLIDYQNNQGKRLQITLQTTAANNKTEDEITQTITLQGVTAKQQAIDIGINALKSIKLQTHTNQFDTDIEKGLWCLQGDIVQTQHTTIESDGQDNGFVLAVETPTNPQLATVRSLALRAVTSGFAVVDEPHRLSPTATDTVVITGNSTAANNATYAPGNWLYVDATSLILSPSQASPGTGGTLSIRRNTVDQVITLSEAITLTAQHRISIAHSDRSVEEIKQLTDLGGGRYRVSAIEQVIAPGDAWILSTVGTESKYWRVTSLKPDIKTNTVSLTGVLWDDDVRSSTGVVLVE